LRLVRRAIVQLHGQAIRIADDVVVRQNVAVIAHDDATAEALLLERARSTRMVGLVAAQLWLLAKEAAQQVVARAAFGSVARALKLYALHGRHRNPRRPSLTRSRSERVR